MTNKNPSISFTHSIRAFLSSWKEHPLSFPNKDATCRRRVGRFVLSTDVRGMLGKGRERECLFRCQRRDASGCARGRDLSTRIWYQMPAYMRREAASVLQRDRSSREKQSTETRERVTERPVPPHRHPHPSKRHASQAFFPRHLQQLRRRS